MLCEVNWLDVSLAAINISIAAYVAYIGFQQWRTSKNTIKLSLYDKRFAVYAATVSLYQELCSATKESIDGEKFINSHKEFIKRKLESRFLFAESSGIYEILDEMHISAFKVIGYKRDGHMLIGSPEELIKMDKNSHQALMDWEKAISKLNTLFVDYLHFKNASE